MRRASEQAGQQEGEQHRRTTDPAPDEETNKNRSDRGGAPRTGRGGQTGRLAECADAKQHGVEGGAPHRAEAFVAIEYEDAGKKGNLHLQTSQQQTRGQADRPDAQTVAKATRYPNGDTQGKALRTTDQHHQAPRVGGPEGRTAAGEHQTKPKTKDKQQDQPKKQTHQQRGARASPPVHEATKQTRDATTTKQKTTETNHKSKGKGHCHDNRPRESLVPTIFIFLFCCPMFPIEVFFPSKAQRHVALARSLIKPES